MALGAANTGRPISASTSSFSRDDCGGARARAAALAKIQRFMASERGIRGQSVRHHIALLGAGRGIRSGRQITAMTSVLSV